MPIHQLLMKHGVNIVFHGHDHLYARQELDGIIYQCVPQPGHTGTSPPRYAEEYGYRKGTILGGSGHVRVTVDHGQARVDFILSRPDNNTGPKTVNGTVSQSYTVSGTKPLN